MRALTKLIPKYLAIGLLCGVAELSAQTGQTVFYDTFESSSGTPVGWITALDGSVTCAPPYQTTQDDIDSYVVPGDSWPGHGRVYVVHANTHAEWATFANSIGYRSFGYLGGGNYRVELDMRMWRNDGRYQNQYFGMNLTFNRNYMDHFAEVNIEASPASNDRGWLMFRQGAPPWTRTRIAYLGTDPKVWQHLIVNVWIDPTQNIYVLESVNIKGKYYVLHVPLATRPTSWTDNFGLLLESNNQYTSCSPSIRYEGIALFDNVKVTYFPF